MINLFDLIWKDRALTNIDQFHFDAISELQQFYNVVNWIFLFIFYLYLSNCLYHGAIVKIIRDICRGWISMDICRGWIFMDICRGWISMLDPEGHTKNLTSKGTYWCISLHDWYNYILIIILYSLITMIQTAMKSCIATP